jgi:hypothetical protein
MPPQCHRTPAALYRLQPQFAHRTGTRLVSTQKAADTEACLRTYASASVQLCMLVNGTTTAAPLVTLCPVMYITMVAIDTTNATGTDTTEAAVVVTESGGGFWKKNIRGCGADLCTIWGRQPPTWNQSCQGVAGGRHLPRGLLRGRAAFTEGERCTGGLLGCCALVLVGLRGASTIGLAAIGFAF